MLFFCQIKFFSPKGNTAHKLIKLAMLFVTFLLANMASLTTASAQTNELVGTIAAKMGITPNGSANYSVPIALPAGTKGLQPKIALQYNSSNGNGLLGMGWSITGLSIITRCGTDNHLDNPANGGAGIDPVDYDANDKFCLNGQRLVAISGAYGADGTEYRTTLEEFSKVVSYGSTGGSPSWFRVWKKNGEILDYGNSTDSIIIGQNHSAARSWALSKISDVRGNYINFSYINTLASGEFYINRIDYTGNDGQGLTPYNHIDFIYEPRPDLIVAHAAGDKITISKRLTNVKAYAEGNLSQDYRIAYETGPTNRSRVTSITQCANETTCLKPTTFQWTANGTSGFQKNENGLNGVANPVINLYKGRFWWVFSNRDYLGYEIEQLNGFNAKIYRRNIIASGDFNGDGRSDLVTQSSYFVHRKYNWYDGVYYWPSEITDQNPDLYMAFWYNTSEVHLANTDGTFNSLGKEIFNSYELTPTTAKNHATGDFNGDGLTDFYTENDHRTSKSRWIWISNGDGTFNRTPVPVTTALPSDYKALAYGDFNGDGLTDIYVAKADDYRRAIGLGNNAADQILLASGDSNVFTSISVPVANNIPDNYAVRAMGDFNGDGLTDFHIAYTDAYERSIADASHTDQLWLSKGDGTFEKKIFTLAESIKSSYKVQNVEDYNKDGLTDFYVSYSDQYGRAVATSSNTDEIWFAKGDGTFEKSVSSLADSLPNQYKVIATGDFNGDSHPDFYVSYVDTTGRSVPTSSNTDSIWFNSGSGAFNKSPQSLADSMPNTFTVAGTGDFNGDGLTDFNVTDFHNLGSSVGKVWLRNPFVPDQLASVTNGHNVKTEFTYKPLTDPSVYTKGTGAVYPVQDITSAGRVVSEVKIDDGLGGQNTQTYNYETLRIHVKAIGFLGFAKMTVLDHATGIKTQNTYSQDWANHQQGLLIESKTIAPDDIILKEKTVTWDTRFFTTPNATPLCFRYSPNSVTINRDLNGSFLSKITETTNFDDYGFPLTVNISTQNEAETETHIKSVANTYTHDTANWRLGQLTQTSVTHQAPGQPNQIRTSSFTYDTFGQLASKTVEPASPLSHTKTYARNSFGAVTSITETWGSTSTDGITPTSRTTSYGYDTKVRYRVSETNPLGHTQTTSYHAVLGLKTSTTGPNGLTTSWAYDAFGRATLETRADGTTTTSARDFCDSGITCPANALFRVRSETSGGALQEKYLDKLNRTVRAQSMVGGQWSITDTVYNNRGQISQKSEPYFSGNTVYWTAIQYDLLGRPTLTTRPDSSTQSMTYNGLTQVSTNALGQTKTVTKNIVGRPVTITDAASQSLTYSYDALGQTISMTDGTVTSSYVYDSRGNKISDTDPDKGTWTYRYNALGLLVEQTNAKGQLTTITYDVLGRMLTRVDDAAAANPGLRTATWVYDTATNGIGKLHTTSSQGYTSQNSYDALGRPSSSSETIDSTTLTSSTTYDSFSRPLTMVYPSGITIKNIYDADGALLEVQDDTGSTIYWQRQDIDARGNITKFKLGNDVETVRSYMPENGNLTSIFSSKNTTIVQDLQYSFDALGNLTQRIDARQNFTENFQYDTLNRVIQVDTILPGSPPSTTTVTITYTSRGNIATKSDVGTYTYGQVHAGCTSGVAGAHAVTSVSGTKNATYCYDANGNMTSGDNRTVSYSAFDKPVMITKGTNITSFTYGPNRARIKRVDQTTSATTTTLYASGKAYEKIMLPSETREKNYIGNFAVITKVTNSGPGSLTTSYLHRDHLGSLDTITDHTAMVTQRLSFDAWGKRREINWQPMSEAASLAFDTTVTTRGYTNHEQIDPVGLIHMNGRVYDAELGRFISADPLVQDTTNLQSFNRFAYVFNNPLSHTDPSGFAGFGISRSTAQQFYYSYYAASLVFKKALNAPGRLAKSITGSPIIAPYTTPQSSQASSIGGTLYQAASTLAEPFVQMAAYAFGSFGTTLNDVAEEASALSYGGSFQEGFYPIVHREEAPQETRTATSRVKSTVVRVIITARSTATSYAGKPEPLLSDEPWYKRINAQHEKGVKQAMAHYESKGFEIMGTEVRVSVPTFEWPRVYDIVVQAGNNLIGIEVKTTINDAITLDKRQVAKDIMVIQKGGTILSGGTLRERLQSRVIQGVGYAGTCFGCQALYANSGTLSQTLRAFNIPINRCDTGASCSIGGKR